MRLHPSSLHLGFFPALAVSSLVHGAFLLAGLISLRFMHQYVSTPIDAVEVSFDGPVLKRGSAHPSVSRPRSTNVAESAVDLSVRSSKAKPKKIAADPNTASAAAAVGQGGSSSVSQGSAGTAWDQYRSQVRQRIHEALIYPKTAKNLGESGQVKLHLRVLRDGTISEVQIAEPCAFDRLNAAAVATIKRVAQLDPFPPSFESAHWETTVPIDFVLR